MKPYEPPTFPPWTGQVSLLEPRRRERTPNPWIIGIGTALMVAAIIAIGLVAARTVDAVGTCAIERWMR